MARRVIYAGLLAVIVGCNLAVSAAAHTVDNPWATVAAFSPKQAIVGQLVTITGDNLDGTTSVTFQGVQSQSVTVDPNGTWVKAVVPPGVSTGDAFITLVIVGGTYSLGPLHINSGSMAPESNPQPSSSSTPTGVQPRVVVAPRIASFSPTSGRVGTLVSFQGANLTGARWVSFGGVRSTKVTVLSSGAELTVRVPKHARSGPVLVTTSGGTSSGGKTFKVTG
jgi:hypothetical protein